MKHAATLGGLSATTRLDGKSSPETAGASHAPLPRGRYRPGRIPNEYNLFLPGEREALRNSPRLVSFVEGGVSAHWDGESRILSLGESLGGWQLLAILPWLNGIRTAVFEKHVTHQGAIGYVTETGEIANIPKRIGDLSRIRSRPTDTPHDIKFERPARFLPGPDVSGDYILNSDEDPSYENVAALGLELIGWALVANAVPFGADLIVHIHPPDRQALRSTPLGEVHADRVVLPASLLAGTAVFGGPRPPGRLFRLWYGKPPL